jgi:hypothetical protein
MNGLNPSNTPWNASQGIVALASATAVTAKAALTNGQRHYVTGIQATNIHATNAVILQILDGTTVLWAMNLPAVGATQPQINIEESFEVPLMGTANTKLDIKCSAAGSVFWNIQGFDAP